MDFLYARQCLELALRLLQACLELLGMFLRLRNLLIDFGDGVMALFGNGLIAKAGIHFAVLMRFAFNGNGQALGCGEAALGIQHIEMAESVLHLLRGGFLDGVSCKGP